MSSEEEDSDIYEVEYIIDKKRKKDGIYYHVKWAGYPLEEATWEHEVNLEGSQELVKEFEEELKKKNKQKNKPKRYLVSKAKLLEREEQKKKDKNENDNSIINQNLSSTNNNINGDNPLTQDNLSNNDVLKNDEYEDETPFKPKNLSKVAYDKKNNNNSDSSNVNENNLNLKSNSKNIDNTNVENNQNLRNKTNDKGKQDFGNVKIKLVHKISDNNNNKDINGDKEILNKNKNIKNNTTNKNISKDSNSKSFQNKKEKKIAENLNDLSNDKNNDKENKKSISNINWTISNRNFNSLKRKISEVDIELQKRHNYILLRSMKKIKLIKGIEKRLNFNFESPKLNPEISIICREKTKNGIAYRIKTEDEKYNIAKPEQLYHCKNAIIEYRNLQKKKNETQLNEFIDKIIKYFDNTHYKRCIYCENEPNPNFQDPLLEDLGPFYSCTKCTSSYHIECIPGYKKNKKKYESNTNICKLCQEVEPTCQVNCIHEGKSEEYLKMSNKLKFFRCSRCDISAHFDCIINEIKKKTDFSEMAIIKYIKAEYLCDRCLCWNAGIQKILTYREKEDGKREFLIKFKNTSYLHIDWVPEDWIKTINEMKYNNFINEVKKANNYAAMYGKPSVWPKSEYDVINPEFYKVEMILDLEFFKRNERHNFFNSYEKIVDIIEFEKKLKRVLIKWEGLPFSEVTWEDYPDPEQDDIMEYRQALEYYLKLRAVSMTEPVSYNDLFRNDPYFTSKFKALTEQHPSVVGGTLKDYQIDGVNWLLYKWTKRQSCILADEMGLGKTIQIIAFLSTLKEQYNCFPFLIIAPLSTIDNWFREFKKWVPDMIVVKYEGEKESRNIISKYLLRGNNNKLSSYHGGRVVNCHVLLTTPYLFRLDLPLFKSVQPKWEVVVVDEGHCLKTENGRLVSSISDLNIDFKVILTGTPLQNTIQELYNILNFLDPLKFHDAKHMQNEFETLDEEKLKEIRESLKPYMLRRSKSLVLKLPPKTETIVPVSMTSLQKRVYKGILEKNFQVLTSEMKKKSTFSSSSNVLMQLKKCLNHPYLNNGIEPEFKNIEEEHTHLIDACAKFQLLQIMLKKLKEQNHRVLIFSTMKILLDLLERFLEFEHYKYTRLDGETSNRERQQRIDAFNAPDSDIFIFLLSTRAGGQGINLASADTIIMYDHDWNPQADIQALSRAHRIGQKKIVAAYKLVTKDSAEERIIQVGNRKLALDQLIVNSLSKNKHPIKKEDMLSILRYGAKSLFEENEQESEQDLRWDEKSVEELLNRTRIPPEENNEDKEKYIDDEFSFAKVWTMDKNLGQNEGHLETLDNKNVEDSSDSLNQDEFWDNLLKEREKFHIRQLSEEYGVGKRKRTKTNYSFDYSINDEDEINVDGDGDYSSETTVYSSDEFDVDIHDAKDSIKDLELLSNGNNLVTNLVTNNEHIKSKAEENLINRPPCWLCLQEYHPVHLCPSIVDRSLIYSRYLEISQQPARSYFQAIQLQILEFYLNIGANNSKVYIETNLEKPSLCFYCNNLYHPPEFCSNLRDSLAKANIINKRLKELPYFKNNININNKVFQLPENQLPNPNAIANKGPNSTTDTATAMEEDNQVYTTPWERYLNAIKIKK